MKDDYTVNVYFRKQCFNNGICAVEGLLTKAMFWQFNLNEEYIIYFQ